ncbi:NAD(P)-dependent alcohol dehydrogenase [Tropicimonas sp. TH_r6]|uniref:NAD(P)-dependent alcohol dehydrogenase n=1 Tax=Tropicimonas sp. TH_r6 TaxID=3082085 RepID=UPI0029557841|nr:NAD(P)-dependent alcohol dehydrogenase [Tropicimonas sp. TH_r6]MDV7141666.1 NAD(P)-dependent alcohol dehydrogenase [Tropicimonas sp. TH_r6]
MKAALYREYGGPEVVTVQEIARPEPQPGEVRVRVEAAAVTSADWRLREAAFPSFTVLPGRLMFGLFRPRKPVLGGAFAGRIDALGEGVSSFQQGQPVFGFAEGGAGAHAEYLIVKAAGAIAARPERLSAQEAASLPFGGLAALVFLRDFAKLKPGERVLVLGASGGVGVHAVQIARALGADVDAVCGARNAELVRELGAERVFDHRQEDFAASGTTWDVIFDCVGASSFGAARGALRETGRYVPLDLDCATLFAALTNRFRKGPKVVIGVSPDRREDLETLSAMVTAGTLRPVLDRIYPLDEARAAHEDVSARRRSGVVVLAMP